MNSRKTQCCSNPGEDLGEDYFGRRSMESVDEKQIEISCSSKLLFNIKVIEKITNL